jgi:hypothetical protein
MPDYTIFILNRENEITDIKLAAGLTADGVLAKAAEMVNDQHGAEVWNLARVVATLAPNDRS